MFFHFFRLFLPDFIFFTSGMVFWTPGQPCRFSLQTLSSVAADEFWTGSKTDSGLKKVLPSFVNKRRCPKNATVWPDSTANEEISRILGEIWASGRLFMELFGALFGRFLLPGAAFRGDCDDP